MSHNGVCKQVLRTLIKRDKHSYIWCVVSLRVVALSLEAYYKLSFLFYFFFIFEFVLIGDLHSEQVLIFMVGKLLVRAADVISGLKALITDYYNYVAVYPKEGKH